MRLNDISTIKTGIVFSRKKAAVYDVIQEHYSQVTLKLFSAPDELDAESSNKFVSNKAIEKGYLTQKGDILIRLRSPNTAIYIDDSIQGLVISSLICVIRVKKDFSLNKEFLVHYLNSKSVQNKLARFVKGTTIPMIRTSDIANIEITPLPSLDMQTKVAHMMRLLQEEKKLLISMSMQKEILAKGILTDIINQSRG